MAATMIKETVFGSDEVDELMKAMGWNEREAIGCLALLWAGSQRRGVERATPKQIGYWCRVDGDESVAKLVSILSDELVSFIKSNNDGTYTIVGNSKHIAKIDNWKSSGKKGGRKTREKWKGMKNPQNQRQDAEPNAVALGSVDPLANATTVSLLSSSLLSSSLPVFSGENSAPALPKQIDLPPDPDGSFKKLLEKFNVFKLKVAGQTP
ncbi:MAG: hypothetical protein A2428_02980 [Bdellovibrionales bacterium RIFOXYC1_FULL_54_43]|nr:MAG: hypothetical protein A2428_02980 [Bdellovibrionales bacterium RIFOXYC1_FULL_54_43]OFZ82645.1 MAG: hypothetical protein A2603_02415 [Bdellovibrionales bacterium RIFOXYD1_FULL_55_31]